MRSALALLVLAGALAAATTVRADDYIGPSEMKGALATALGHEQRAAKLLASKNYSLASKEAYAAWGILSLIMLGAVDGRAKGDLSQGESQQIAHIAKTAAHADFTAFKEAKARHGTAAKVALAEAAVAKQHLAAAIADLAGGAQHCTATKEFDVYAIPQGFAGSYADVYPHGVPKGADNIKVSFIDTATGKAPAPELFPGQTWTATNKGFLPDGRLDLRVDVSGTGFGAQDANKRHWKVVVTYDC